MKLKNDGAIVAEWAQGIEWKTLSDTLQSVGHLV